MSDTSSVRFYHAVAGSTVILPDGRIKTFFGGYCDVERSDKVALAAMQELTKSPGSGVKLSPLQEAPTETATAQLAELNQEASVKSAAALSGKQPA